MRTLALAALVAALPAVAGADARGTAKFAKPAVMKRADPVPVQPMFCGMREAIAARLAAHYSEGASGGGPTQRAFVEIWAAAEGRTWTLLVTHPDGTSCILASGNDWVTIGLPRGEGS